MQGVFGSDDFDLKFPDGNTELVFGVVKCPIHVTFILISIFNKICYQIGMKAKVTTWIGHKY